MSLCSHAKITGYVTNQDLLALDKSRPLYSRVVCSREACIEAMKAKVTAKTGEPAMHVLYPTDRI